ncbi:hypothetical protein DFH06DRAFT_1223658 [Mycena polygramma]|nr:hypothetical protein DFH06DRAFT_1223658 [Mycena polygramma]
MRAPVLHRHRPHRTLAFAMTSNEQRLEELQLIQFTLLPEEVLTFLDDEGLVWAQLLRDYGEDAVDSAIPWPSTPPHIQVKPQSSKIWFDVRFPAPDSPIPLVSVKGENATRAEQERWRGIIHDKMHENEIAASDFPVYQLLCLHLLPLLHDEMPTVQTDVPTDEPPATVDDTRFHALFTSHHLISPKKRRALQQWSGALAIAGFAKVGHPGLIYVQGARGSVEEFVDNVRAMQWLALRLRFLEPLPGEDQEGQARGWTEFEKVGEAVEAMRRLGLEDWIVEMGVGSRSS